MKRRTTCLRPESEPCVAAKRGPCRSCADFTATRARMKALNADPEFAAKRDAIASARMKALHADPEFKAATRARMKLKVRKSAPADEHQTSNGRN